MQITINLPIEKPVAAVKAVKNNVSYNMQLLVLKAKLARAVNRYDVAEITRISRKIIVL